MKFEEFFKTIYYTKDHIILPLFNRTKIERKQFTIKGKYDKVKEREYLQEVFNMNKQRFE